MLTATKDLMLPATVTGSWPRPRWYDGGLWGRPLDTALLDVRFREQFLDAHATVIADQERAGLDVLIVAVHYEPYDLSRLDEDDAVVTRLDRYARRRQICQPVVRIPFGKCPCVRHQ